MPLKNRIGNKRPGPIYCLCLVHSTDSGRARTRMLGYLVVLFTSYTGRPERTIGWESFDFPFVLEKERHAIDDLRVLVLVEDQFLNPNPSRDSRIFSGKVDSNAISFPTEREFAFDVENLLGCRT